MRVNKWMLTLWFVILFSFALLACITDFSSSIYEAELEYESNLSGCGATSHCRRESSAIYSMRWSMAINALDECEENQQ